MQATQIIYNRNEFEKELLSTKREGIGNLLETLEEIGFYDAQCVGHDRNKAMKEQADFEKIARKKIAGWYSSEEYENKAIARMVSQREEISKLLLSTGRQGVDNVLQYLDDSGFYYRASSPHGHHNYPGGLAEHSLGTYKLAQASGMGLPRDSVIICALLHDICKSDRFWFKGRSIRQHTPKCEMDSRHSVRSIVILRDCGLSLSEAERRAIRWHMKGPGYHSRDKRKESDHAKATTEELWRVVFYSDKRDAAAHPGK